ncbi:MAG: amylo-alpha-1,6-glucosidase [bacterium]
MNTQIRLNPRFDTTYVSRDRTVLATDRTGVIPGGSDYGLYVYQTRLLSRYRYLVNGAPPDPVVGSNVSQHTWQGYYICVPPRIARPGPDTGSGRVRDIAQETLELRVSRTVGPGLQDDLVLTNWTQHRTNFRFEVELESDFADQDEVLQRRRLQRGRRTRRWSRVSDGVWELVIDYRAHHDFSHQEERGRAAIHRGVVLRVEHTASGPVVRGNRVGFDLSLDPHASVLLRIVVIPIIDGARLSDSFERPFEQSRQIFLSESTRFHGPSPDGDLTALVQRTMEQARSDLIALRLYDLDHGERAWTMAAGVPVYVALFGRDTQATAWQAGVLGPEMLRGTLLEMPRWQGRETNDWRDEQPGRMLHEAHTGPLAALNFTPRARYYGSANTSTFYPLAVAELWHWTGDKEMIGPMIQPALDAIAWTERHLDLDGDGFFEYHSRSSMGVKHQAWKDSGDAVVYEDGSQVDPPIATCEEQGFVYVAWLHFAEVLLRFGRKEEAQELFRKAEELRGRFNEAFWMPDRGFYAFGLDSRKRQITSIVSNPGHCLGAGIVDRDRAERVADRLLAEDLFSGWGVRTLSSAHPAYNPFSYHRGSVWPVEQGTFALGFMRYGLHDHMHRLARAFFDSASLFELSRLPEVYSGHPRDLDHPFPALYPRANWPQAWSASAVFVVLQSLLGLYPYAPMATLFVDPHLPAWLPELTVEGLRVGAATVSLRFFRRPDGSSDYRVLSTRGRLHVLRQPSPWSVSATTGERVRDLLESLLPGR